MSSQNMQQHHLDPGAAQDQDPLLLDSDIKHEHYYHYHQSHQSTIASLDSIDTGNGDITNDGSPQVDLLSLEPATGEHVSVGRLPLDLLATYSGPGMEWRRFLTICSPATAGELYLFDVGRAGHLYYLRAYTEEGAAVGAHWRLQIGAESQNAAAAAVLLEGDINAVGGGQPRLLPSALRKAHDQTFRITIRP
jgi:hypothetical protein